MRGVDMPETRYAITDDGVSIAYHVAGDGPVDVAWLHAFMGSLEIVWEYEAMRTLTEELSSFARVIRHDMRATGLSGRAASLPDLETQMRDLLAVLDAAGSRSTVIVGAGPGAHLALLFGATYPARARALVLYDLYAWSGELEMFEGRDLDLLTRSWGTEAAAAAAMAQVAPSLVGDRAFLRWYARMQRHFIPPDGAAELMRIGRATDIRPIMPAVHVPTLVLAREWTGWEQDREVAQAVEGSRFELLPGTERASFAGDQASLCAAIRDFLGLEPPRPAAQTLLRAVLFTDIVGSTEHLSRVGDRAWRELIVQHDARSAAAVDAHGGRIVKSTGDGVLATFEGPAQAVRGARAIGEAVADLEIEVRAGVHVGEIEAIGEDVAGVTVNVAARVSALAGAGEVLVSSTVKDLIAGSGLAFEDAGEHALKGIPGSWRVFRLVDQQATDGSIR
jgi:class 3 adenylate cyclase